MQLAQAQGKEKVMDIYVRFFGVAVGLGAQEAKEQQCTYLNKILDFEQFFGYT